jgi:hypothetical protein
MVTALRTLLVTVVVLTGCNDRPQLTLGEECAINTDCASPLGCRLGQCRRLCIALRDCPDGSRCIRVAGEDSGACQLQNETECVMSSDCANPALVCSFGTCTTECREDRDCIDGSICQEGTCVYLSPDVCVYDSDCDPPLVCAADQSCQYECRADVDCDPPRICCLSAMVACDVRDENLCILPPM